MSVSGELLCSFELLKPLDSSALKSHIKKGRNKRNSMLNSPVSDRHHPRDQQDRLTDVNPSLPWSPPKAIESSQLASFEHYEGWQ